jgi:hypothetical protein
MRENSNRHDVKSATKIRFKISLRGVLGVVAVCLLSSSPSFAEDALPPWNDTGDVPVPQWARSVVPNREEAAVYSEPGRLDSRRGSAVPSARMPFFATRRGDGCAGRWLNVGPMAWVCSDVADWSPEAPIPFLPLAKGLPPIDPESATDDGLPHRYYFAGRDGASGFMNLSTALDDTPDQELEAGFAVAILEERFAHDERWGKTKKGRWIAMRELVPVRSNTFHGELVPEGQLDLAWVTADKANVYPTEKADRPNGSRVRFEKIRVFEEKGTSLRISADGETPSWMRARDLARTRLAEPPPEVRGDEERWIDVDLTQQTLVAYSGKRPVFATIVSTGKGPPGSEFATHPGTFRVWAKLFTTKMDNLDKEEAEKHYAIEDVPWVQFFDKAIALHGAFWHRDFGRMHSHGCVNMAPLDARWVFAFTAPTLPVGWSAVLPTKIEQGAVIRVR